MNTPSPIQTSLPMRTFSIRRSIETASACAALSTIARFADWNASTPGGTTLPVNKGAEERKSVGCSTWPQTRLLAIEQKRPIDATWRMKVSRPPR